MDGDVVASTTLADGVTKDAQGAPQPVDHAVRRSSKQPRSKGEARRRGHNEGSIYQLPNGTYRGAVSLGFGPDGKPRRKYVSGKTRAEVNRKVTALRHDVERGAPISTQGQTLATFLAAWLKDVVKPTRRAKTYQSYESTCRIHLIPGLGRHRLDRLTPQHVQALLSAKRAEGVGGRSLANIRAVLRIALNQAMQWDLVARNVAALTDAPKQERFEATPLSEKEAERFLKHVAGERLSALYVTAIALGLRQGELLGLSWSDVDLVTGTLQVRVQLQWGRAAPGAPRLPQLVSTKTARSKRRLPLPDDVLDALKRHRTRQLEERLAAGGAWPAAWDLVFCSTTGTPLDPANVTHRFKAALSAAKLPDRRFHDLRHTTGTFLTARGVHPRVIMEILGHSQISTTMNTYAHVEQDTLREALAHARDPGRSRAR